MVGIYFKVLNKGLLGLVWNLAQHIRRLVGAEKTRYFTKGIKVM